jgi:hypothetical protein
MPLTRFLPCPELRELLLHAYAPCRHFTGACEGVARWEPATGFVPRGFLGALGSLDEVELVLVAAEPGDPLPGETYDGTDPAEFLEQCAERVYRIFAQRHDLFHRNIRSILDLCFPDLDFCQQLRRTWITESYLCSAPVEGRHVPVASSRTCAHDYLLPQLELLKDRAIVALGKTKAQPRMQALGIRFLPASSAARPEGNKPKARESWTKIPQHLRETEQLRRPG